MKSNLHFYKWLIAVIVLICTTTTVSAQTKVTSFGQLKAGCVIKIYPKGKYGISHYYESEYALACSGDEQPLTSYEKAGSGDEWTLEDAGDGFCYIKNDKGCFWAYQGSSSSESLKCTTDKSSAVRIALTWDSKYNGLCFWNEKDGKGLNNLYEYYYRYNWWSDPNDYSIDANTTFDIVLLKEGNGYNFSGDESIEIILNGIKYRLNIDKTAEVLANDYSGDIIIPENVTYNDVTYRITSLENGCFNDCSYLTSISLPDGITSLGKNCFYSCDKLTSISLPDGITSVGNNCFSGCSSLTSISLPEGLTSLGNECFRGCSNLTNISLPDGLTSLNLGCFESCCSLTSINLPASLTSLSAGCLNYCSSLTTIELPDGITSIGPDCFYGCISLKSIKLPAGLTSMGYDCFYGCSSLTNIELQAGLTSLEGGCFYGCSSLKSIKLPDGITSLGYDCFGGCSSLESIKLPAGLTLLEEECFIDCSSLTTIELPTGLTSLGDDCFENCSSLTSMLCFAVEPPICYTNVVDKTTRLYVPKESIEKYEQKAAWNGAKGIYPLYPTDSISLPKEVSVILAKPTKIEYTILPENAGTKELKWSSEDPEVATVDENGVVTGMKLGETVITATATDDSIVSATCKVTVMPSTAINGITIGNIKLTVENRCLKVEGLADNDIIKISDYAGSTVYRGTEHKIYLNASGVYIVEVKGTTLKIHVK